MDIEPLTTIIDLTTDKKSTICFFIKFIKIIIRRL